MSAAFVERLARLQERIDRAARSAGRDPGAIDLIAVAKSATPDDLAGALRAGIRHVGESRVQDALPRMASPAVVAARAEAEAETEAEAAPSQGPLWHFIGHCQTNKARAVVEHFDRLDSVDSVRLAGAIGRWAVALRTTMPVLVEINVAREAGKHGLSPTPFDALADSVVEIDATEGLRVEGLMAIAPLAGGRDAARAAFRELADLAQRLGARMPETSLARVSMGMSDDFESAIEHGSTEVRIGRALFAPPGNGSG